MILLRRHKGGLLLSAALMASSPAVAASPEEDARVASELGILMTPPGAALTPDDATDAKQIGQRIRWAGGVHSISPSERGVCLTILYARSGEYGEPQWTPDPTYQTFVACTDGAYDPQLVQAHTNVTIIGTVTGKRYIGMGGGGSEGPVVTIERLYRWSDCLAGDDSPACRTGFLEPAATVDESDAKSDD
ncbi:Slp family lipoprotein [Sphingopyxis sp.]|uniref:Slp family lipoprotein n=1 Tax=Sphingopyxis sp. TaxID=1908224 RepID=UPI003D12D93D